MVFPNKIPDRKNSSLEEFRSSSSVRPEKGFSQMTRRSFYIKPDGLPKEDKEVFPKTGIISHRRPKEVLFVEDQRRSSQGRLEEVVSSQILS